MANSTSNGPAFSWDVMAHTPAEITAFWRAMMRVPAAITAENLRFAAQRLNAQADHMSTMAGCADVAQVMKSQSTFMETAVQAYRTEAEVLVKELQNAVAVAKKAA